MNKKINIILKIFIVILFSLLLINITNVYAVDMDKIIEQAYDKVETEDGTLYKRKKLDSSNCKIGYNSFQNSYNEENQKFPQIVTEKVNEYMKKFTSR